MGIFVYILSSRLFMMFLTMLGVALFVSSIGFKKYVWFISLGYGFSVCAIGITLTVIYAEVLFSSDKLGVLLTLILLTVYGARLGGYLLYRELKSSAYNTKMKTEIKSGKNMTLFVRCCIWTSAALLYACQTCPVLFRLENGKDTDIVLVIGSSLSVLGFIVECVADYQKSAAKKKNPKRFVDTGLYKIVRCPNYFGELLIWTGIFVGGTVIYSIIWQWIASVTGYVGIVYVMFSGARRLEERQNRTYGKDPEYQAYFKKTPIMIPLVPLYSVIDWKWLVA